MMPNPVADQLAARLRDAGLTPEVRYIVMCCTEAGFTAAAEMVETANPQTTATPQEVGHFLRSIASAIHDIGTA